MTALAASIAAQDFDLVPSRSYRAGSPERARLEAALTEVRSAAYDLPLVIGGREVRTGNTFPILAPHERATALGSVHTGSAPEVEAAVAAAREAGRTWGRLPADERAAPFLRAADMLSEGPWRDRLVAATMVELSKTAAQADGDVAEAADFIRANVANMAALESVQPVSPAGFVNHVDYRPLEGFVLAISPFNYTSMNNLAFGPALLGNSVLWKPASTAALVANLSLQLLREAGLPDGVISLLNGEGREIGDLVVRHPELAAIHFTGSTRTFRSIWDTVGRNVSRYRDFPRIVGETGGKGFVAVHPSADVEAVAVACVRGAYEYQGQKCAAVTRVYAPRSLWPALKERLIEQTEALAVGDPTMPGTQLGAVISGRQHAGHVDALAQAREENLVLAGGDAWDTPGWFVQPTLLEVSDPRSRFMTEEFFGPIMAVYVYEDSAWEETLRLVDGTSEYGLTGAVFAADESAIAKADRVLRYTAGNYYINDKPTGAAVGQQPFGGARASGTNDKAGTVWNTIRFTSPRTTKWTQTPDSGSRIAALDG
ncbi:L-glutamate gamma-semialdehyde dehydrogenase [Sinomonas mesophila]|uniref:L-glutamate gamma-semialdehyde dehydrogenase n=1 Tax=Sinomonas mesophila TaxID=1531955 RepID=UPI001FE25803|nr:L-glutamate gamma-semialdehyde dehydrogenase [Sinomonas mesophila]